MIKHDQYVPVLKWRQGEYQALNKLNSKTKDRIVPLIVIPPIEYDFAEEKPKKTIDQHLEKFAKRVHEKWGKRFALIDLHESIQSLLMSNGDLSIKYIMDSLDDLSCNYSPVLHLTSDPDYIEEVHINTDYTNGVSIRITLNDMAGSNINQLLDEIIDIIELDKDQIDLIIDLVRPESYTPYDGFCRLVIHYVNNINDIDAYRSLVLVGTSLNISAVKPPGGLFDRDEWIFYKTLVEDHIDNGRVPSFGDYAIEPPEFQSVDFRLMTPSGKIIYTSDETWLVAKGGSFRNNPGQMHDHSNSILSSGHFLGKAFSWGDERIDQTAKGLSPNYGQLSTWKQVGVNHHLTFVADQVSSFFLI